MTFPFEDSPGNTLERQFSINNASNPSDGGSVIETQTGTGKQVLGFFVFFLVNIPFFNMCLTIV